MQKNSSSFHYKKSYSRGKRDFRFKRDDLKFRYNRNNYIRAATVRLIDENGENIGEVDIKKAQSLAQEAGLDLVEIGPKANPPVCKIISWSKFVYEQKKKERKNRRHRQKEMKEVRFGTFIAQGDKQRKVEDARRFLSEGHNVKITVRRKGRTPIQQSKEMLGELLTLLSEYSTIGSSPSTGRRDISMILKGEIGKPRPSQKEGSKEKPKIESDKKDKVKTVKKDAKVENKKDSSKKVQKDKTSGRKGSKDSVQQKSSGTSKDKKVKSKKK